MRVTIALLALLALGVACVHRGDGASAQVPAAKLDPGLRRLLAASSPPDSVVGIFIRLVRPAGADERAALERAGARIGTVTGDLLTARVALRDVPEVAALQIVRYIELSRRLYPQRPRQGRSDPTASHGKP